MIFHMIAFHKKKIIFGSGIASKFRLKFFIRLLTGTAASHRTCICRWHVELVNEMQSSCPANVEGEKRSRNTDRTQENYFKPVSLPR